MAYNGSGTFNRLYDWTNERDAGNNIDATKMDAEHDGFASGLSNCVTKDGQTTIAANLPMNGYKHTGVADASARNQYAAAGQIQDGEFIVLGSVSGTDTITASASPAISAYTAGMAFNFVSAGANTGAVTLNVNSVGAKSVTKAGTTALAAGDIPSGAVITVVYDGAQFQIANSRNISAFGASLIDDASAAAARATLGAQQDVITTRGDIVRGSSGNVAERLALGAAKTFLRSDGTDVAFSAIQAADVPSGTYTGALSGVIAAASGTTSIPRDNTTPLVSEGTEIWSQAITPPSSSHKVRVEFSCAIGHSTSGTIVAIAVFRGSTCIGVVEQSMAVAGGLESTHFLATDSPASGSSVTYSARIGTNSGTWYVNSASSALYNGELAKQGYTLVAVE